MPQYSVTGGQSSLSSSDSRIALIDAGSRGHHDERAPIFLVVAEDAQRRLDLHGRARRRLPQPLVRVAAAGNAPHVKVDQVARGRRGHGETARLAVGQHHVHVLAGHVIQHLWQRQRQVDDVVAKALDAVDRGADAAGIGKHLPAAGHADAQVAGRTRLAGQGKTLFGLFGGQRHGEFVVAHRSRFQLDAAGAAAAERAFVRQLHR